MPKPDNSLQARLDRAIASGGSKVLIANLQKKLGISGGSSSSSNTWLYQKTMPKPDNSLQARLDRAIASGGSKVLIANLQKKLGISGGSSSSSNTWLYQKTMPKPDNSLQARLDRAIASGGSKVLIANLQKKLGISGGSSSSSNTWLYQKTMPKPDNSLQARLDRAIASGGSKVLIANLQKKLGISGGSSSSSNTWGSDTSGYTTDQQNFEKGWQAYTGAQKWVYDLETSRGIEQYDLKQQEYQKQLARNREDYARYTSDAQTQMNRQLGQSSKEFSRKLASASNAYGQRGILRSGFAKNQIGEATTDFQDSQTYFKTQTQRQIEAQQQGYDRQYSDISTNATNLQKQKEQYQGDRSVWRQVLDTQLQYQGDTQYNTLQTSQYQTNQALLAQEARNNRYGVQSNASKRTWRIGGSYTS